MKKLTRKDLRARGIPDWISVKDVEWNSVAQFTYDGMIRDIVERFKAWKLEEELIQSTRRGEK